mgnify:CR=1 FL=1
MEQAHPRCEPTDTEGVDSTFRGAWQVEKIDVPWDGSRRPLNRRVSKELGSVSGQRTP